MTQKKQLSIIGLLTILITVGVVWYRTVNNFEPEPLPEAPILQEVFDNTITVFVPNILENFIDAQLPDLNTLSSEFDIKISHDQSVNNISFAIDSSPNGSTLHTHTLVPVTKHSTHTSIVSSELQNGIIDGTIWVSASAIPFIYDIYDVNDVSIQPHTISEITDYIQKGNIALISFEKLTLKFMVLDVDDNSLLTPSERAWPLTSTLEVTGPNSSKIANIFSQFISPYNFDEKIHSTVAVTGVTAISRGVEYEINRRNDPLYPAREIMGVLSQADITHVDNESPLFDNCIPETEGIVLCGKTRSLESLTAIGTDIVDLTGNHQNDYGYEANIESITHLNDAGIEHFGGGINQEDAEKILYKTVNDTTFAFVGYNYFDSQYGPTYGSLALGERPGSNFYSEEKMITDITEAKSNADIVFVHFQFIEKYQYNPLPEQVEVFRKAIDTGADVVVGVQSHQPQKVEFYGDGVIYYGLGNLFFDQMWSEPTRQGIIPWMSFYDGKLINTHLFTTLLYDYAQPRFTNGQQRTEVLSEILP